MNAGRGAVLLSALALVACPNGQKSAINIPGSQPDAGAEEFSLEIIAPPARIFLGYANQAPVRVINRGRAAVSLDKARFESENHAVEGDVWVDLWLEPGEEKEFQVRLVGNLLGDFAGVLTISNFSSSAEAPMTGRVVACPEVWVPAAFVYGDPGVLRTTTATLTSRSADEFPFSVTIKEPVGDLEMTPSEGFVRAGERVHLRLSRTMPAERKYHELRFEFGEPNHCGGTFYIDASPHAFDCSGQDNVIRCHNYEATSIFIDRVTVISGSATIGNNSYPLRVRPGGLVLIYMSEIVPPAVVRVEWRTPAEPREPLDVEYIARP